MDRLVVKDGMESRLADSIENVMKLSDGIMIVDVIGGEPINFSMNFSCPDCGISIDEIEPRSFLSIIRLEPALYVRVLATKWNLTRNY